MECQPRPEGKMGVLDQDFGLKKITSSTHLFHIATLKPNASTPPEHGAAPTKISDAPHNSKSGSPGVPTTLESSAPPTPEPTASTPDSGAPTQSKPDASVTPDSKSSATISPDVNDKTSENQNHTSPPSVSKPNATEKSVPPASKSPPPGLTTVHDVPKQPNNQATYGHSTGGSGLGKKCPKRDSTSDIWDIEGALAQA
ncbi:Uncharacterized protein Fot_50884 [Forsythia ovata]|uniref:Uncharacterized protein n=1 Tax=Forsythia ovata TaxID=205694 RepID=A0ABD1PZE1_9LAMI